LCVGGHVDSPFLVSASILWIVARNARGVSNKARQKIFARRREEIMTFTCDSVILSQQGGGEHLKGEPGKTPVVSDGIKRQEKK
jgi:hypothetical protein